MTRTATIPSHTAQSPAEGLTIRIAVPADAAALSRLAQLDSAPAPEPAGMLMAEVGGELRAALALDGGRAIADPFQRTAELVAMLVERARQLEPLAPPRTARRWRRLRAPRPAPVRRA